MHEIWKKTKLNQKEKQVEDARAIKAIRDKAFSLKNFENHERKRDKQYSKN
jgi:hypothetical protein